MRKFDLIAGLALQALFLTPCYAEGTFSTSSDRDRTDHPSPFVEETSERTSKMASILPPVASASFPRLATETAEFIQSPGTILGGDSELGAITLQSGNTLIGCQKPTCVRVHRHSLMLNTGAVALLTKKDDLTIVRLLCEDRSGSAYLIVGKKRIQLLPGEEISLADSVATIAKQISSDSVARRKIHLYALSSGGFMNMCEFLPSSIMVKDDVLRTVLRSYELSDKALSGKLQKMAACLTVVTRSHGQFTRFRGAEQ